MDIDKIPGLDEVEKIIGEENQVLNLEEVTKRIQEEQGDKDYFPLGFKAFDDALRGGVGGGDLIVLTGRTGEGKTTLAQTFTYNFLQLGLPQLWFSYEVDVLELHRKFTEMGIKGNYPIFTPMRIASGSLTWIEDKIKEAILKYNTKVIYIDHLGFLTPKITPENIDRNLSVYLAHITRQLKNLAREQNVIIFLLVHVRKSKEDLGIEDIAHSGGISQEADTVFIIEREKLNNKRLYGNSQGDIYSNVSKISLHKNRRTGQTKFLKAELVNGKFKEFRGVPNEPPTSYYIE